ncbi:MAG: hypothetical protein V9G19_02270 [Tetrasphaera sp.]
MDVDEVERLGRHIRAQADQLNSVKRVVGQVVSRSHGCWAGRDAEHFAELAREVDRTLARVVADLRAFGEEAVRQAGEQRQVSRASGGSAGQQVTPGHREQDFGRRLQGKAHHPEDSELAGLAYAAYGGSDAGSFTAVEVISLPDGLQAVLYKDAGGSGSADDRYVLAFAGTDPLSPDDWLNNAAQLTGTSSQYAEGMALAVALHHRYGDQLVFTGHSLGGGLAAAAAVATGCPAVTYNAAGVSPVTMAEASALRGRFPWETGTAYDELRGGQVRNYQMYGDVLTTAAEANGPVLPDPVGVQHVLDSAPPEPGGSVVGWAFGEHGMGQIIEAMAEKYDDPHGASGTW